MSHMRPTAVAGSFYPAEPGELRATIRRLLESVSLDKDEIAPKAVIAPHAGYVYSGPTAATAYARLAGARGRITRVVLMGPSHRVGFRGLAVSGADGWASPLGDVAVDVDEVARLSALKLVGRLDQAHAQEHSLEVHVPFLQSVLGPFRLVPIVAGEATPEQVAAVLDAAWGGPETAIVISTDLSHFLDYESCRATDAATVSAIERMDPGGLDRHSACGRVPVGGMLVAAKRRGLRIQTLDVRNSGDTAGPRDRVVGYGAWALYEPDSEADIRAAAPDILALARASIAHGLESGTPAVPPPCDGVLARPGAAFVTIKTDGRLRGCIGSATAWRALAADVAGNAFKAAFADPRFPPLSKAEAEGLEMSVSVLTPPVPMAFTDQADLLAQLRPRVDGLIIGDGNKRALFLPSVWEQLPDKAAFLAHLKAKAGMSPDHWSESFSASRFQAVELR